MDGVMFRGAVDSLYGYFKIKVMYRPFSVLWCYMSEENSIITKCEHFHMSYQLKGNIEYGELAKMLTIFRLLPKLGDSLANNPSFETCWSEVNAILISCWATVNERRQLLNLLPLSYGCYIFSLMVSKWTAIKVKPE